MANPLTVLAPIPVPWHARLRIALGTLRAWQSCVESARQTEALVGSPGRYECELREGLAQQPIREGMTQAHATLAEFARLAQANGVDPDAVIAALGGRPAPDVEGPHVHEWRRP